LNQWILIETGCGRSGLIVVFATETIQLIVSWYLYKSHLADAN